MGKTLLIGKNNRPVVFTATRAVAVIPATDVIFPAGVLYIGTAGDVKVLLENNTEYVTFKNVPNATFLPIEVIAVHDDTDAGDMLLLY
jgi:hypothetical protein